MSAGWLAQSHHRPRGPLVLTGSLGGGEQAAGRSLTCPQLQVIRSRGAVGAGSVGLSSTPARPHGEGPVSALPTAQLSMGDCGSNAVAMGCSRGLLRGQHKEGVVKCAVWARGEPDTGAQELPKWREAQNTVQKREHCAKSQGDGAIRHMETSRNVARGQVQVRGRTLREDCGLVIMRSLLSTLASRQGPLSRL